MSTKVKPVLIGRIIFDIAAVGILHALYFLIKAFGFHKWVFFCEDYSIRYPYHPNTISTLGVTLYGYLLPLFTIILLEIFLALYAKLRLRNPDALKQMLAYMYDYCIAFLLAGGVTFFLTTVTKYVLGRLRPHFLDVCKPTIFTPTCAGLVANYDCQGTEKKHIMDAFLSFMSGHASTASCGALFTALYLQVRLQLVIAPLIRPLLQFGVIASCLYICITRVTDNYHHPTDVLFGALVGSLSALFAFFWYLHPIRRTSPSLMRRYCVD